MKINFIDQSVQWEKLPGIDTLSAICRAGKTCYKAENIRDVYQMETFIKSLIKRGHESVLEHSLASFRIICSRGLSHELVRHRICNFSQESTRYCNYNNKGFQFIIPDGMIIKPTINAIIIPLRMPLTKEEIWIKHMNNCAKTYQKLIELGNAPEFARGVLPIDLKTELVMSANLREWRHIIKLRTGKGAHPQIRRLIGDILDMFLNTSVKCVFGDLKIL